MAQRHRRLDGVQVHSAKVDVSGQRAMEEENTGMVSCCRQPSEEEGRLERERESESKNKTIKVKAACKQSRRQVVVMTS